MALGHWIGMIATGVVVGIGWGASQMEHPSRPVTFLQGEQAVEIPRHVQDDEGDLAVESEIKLYFLEGEPKAIQARLERAMRLDGFEPLPAPAQRAWILQKYSEPPVQVVLTTMKKPRKGIRVLCTRLQPTLRTRLSEPLAYFDPIP